VLKLGNAGGSCKYFLLSGTEGDRLLPLMWKKKRGEYRGRNVSFLHYPDLDSGMHISLPTQPQQPIADIAPAWLYVQLRLFNGECSYHLDLLPLLRSFTGHVTKDDLLPVARQDPEYMNSDASSDTFLELYDRLRNMGVLAPTGLLRMLPTGAVMEANDFSDAHKTALLAFLGPLWENRGVRGAVGECIRKLVHIRDSVDEFEGSDILRMLTGV